MAERGSDRVTVAELMARMGEGTVSQQDKVSSTAKNRQQVQKRSAQQVMNAGDKEYVPRRLRGSVPDSGAVSRRSSSATAPTFAERRQSLSSPHSESDVSWNDIVQETDWSAADKLESWPHRNEPITAGQSLLQLSEVEEHSVVQKQSADSAGAAPLLDTYSSERPQGVNADFDGEEDHAPYTAGMEILDPDEVATNMSADAEDTATHSTEHVTSVDNATGRDKWRQLVHRLRHSLTRDTSEENLAMTTRILQIAQVIITAVSGGLLFWGFGILWAKPGLGGVTFVLALVVQVIMVLVARLLRRKEEFWVLVLTFVVAFCVTVGPLVLPQ